VKLEERVVPDFGLALYGKLLGLVFTLRGRTTRDFLRGESRSRASKAR
jgi:hypothetical protein